MTSAIFGIIASILAIIMGLWQYFSKKSAYKRKIMEEAEKDLNDAHKNKDKSSLLDGWDKSNRVR